MQNVKLIWQKHVFRALLKSKLWVGKVEISHFDLSFLWQKRPPNARANSLPFSSDGCVVKAVFSQILMKNRKFCTQNFACTIFFFNFATFKVIRSLIYIFGYCSLISQRAFFMVIIQQMSTNHPYIKDVVLLLL